ncbi:hypothetical protein GEV33_009781 [Tenebrio molitor]|uniref:DH domain-containing protein n=1 Tax=Tenebrio molitor TaxID=7067 RepID=A0A8J6LBC3_TENMO|nr:hypothetical protein GEV33_009781 [Tenebrio molitor]
MSTPEVKNKAVRPCVVLLEPITPKANVDFSAELKKVINERNMLTTKTRKRVTEALEEIQCETEENNRKNKKQNILTEILESEENYIRQLEVIMEFFIKPVKDRELLKSRDFDALFSDISTIYRINKELLGELKKSPHQVAKAFSSIAPFFKSYSFYASGFRRSLEVLQNCHRDNPKFANFLEMQETRPEVQSKLSALLIAPIQRVPRYKLLLTSLFNLTMPSEEEYDSLLDSLTKVENAADHINKIIQEQENMQRLIELQRCLQSGEPNVITPGRYLIKEGLLMRISPKTGHSQKMHVVVMNDIVMFCKMKKDELKVQKVLDKGAFKVICENEEMVLYHESYHETIKWIDEIEGVIRRLVDDRKTLKKENTVRRPVKRKDLGEYNEIGLSPGKKLRKRKSVFVEENDGVNRPLLLAKRRPIRTTLNVPSETQNTETTPSFLVTLKPPESRQFKDNQSITRSDNNVSKDLFVFGKPQVDRGFSFKMNQWLCGIGSSFKKILGFK